MSNLTVRDSISKIVVRFVFVSKFSAAMARPSSGDANSLNKLLVCFEDITGRDLWPKIQEAQTTTYHT